jgi:hypothetical protein
MNRLLLVFCLSLAACGGSLKYTIDDNTLANTQGADREPINQARTEEMRAEDGLREAQRNEKVAENERDVAANDYKSAKLQKDSAKGNRQLAEQSGDVNRKNKAMKDYTVTEKASDEADAKAEWLNKKYKWAKTMREAAELLVQLDRAKIELEKARICAAKNIRPNDKFNVLEYEQQKLQYEQKFNERRRDADQMHADVDDKERKYLSKKSATDSARAAAI